MSLLIADHEDRIAEIDVNPLFVREPRRCRSRRAFRLKQIEHEQRGGWTIEVDRGAWLPLLAVTAAQAQSYPSKAVGWSFRSPPGAAPTSSAARSRQKLNEIWGQPVVVDTVRRQHGNRHRCRLKSPPDGYTCW